MQGAEYIVKALEHQGVDIVFGYPGGAIMPLYDALIDAKFKHVLCRHEQGAALAADGYARASGRVGVCLATSGPGATNTVTGIANAYMDSIPMVVITGQVALPLVGTDGFQEVDVFGITMPIVKHNFFVRHADELPDVIHQAFQIAQSGRPGPVLIDIPKDVMFAEMTAQFFDIEAETPVKPAADALAQARQLLKSCQRPVIYAGGGVILGDAVDTLREFAAETGIPVVTTLKGIGVLSCFDEQNFGMLGMHGMAYANHTVHDADLLLCVGARFDDRATGKLATFAANADIIHLDIDPAEIGKLKAVTVGVVGDIKQSLQALQMPLSIQPWQQRCQQLRIEEAWDYDAPIQGIYAPAFLKQLSEKADANTYISCDVGQHQMWVAQHYRFHHPRQHLTSGGLGTMGYGLPAAIGAQFAQPEAQSLVVSGDGSIMMNIQELATLKRYQIPVKIVLFDNQTLGMVRQWQELFFQERFSETDLSDNPDFVKVAEAFGVTARFIDQPEQVAEAIDTLLAHQGSYFLHVKINEKENVWPLVPPGQCNSNMMKQKEESTNE